MGLQRYSLFLNLQTFPRFFCKNVYLCRHMNIDTLARLVKDAVMQHDSVTLPGLGCFVAELVPASFTDKGYTITPPYRRLYFIPRQGGDSILADALAKETGTSPEAAIRTLVEFVTEMRQVLISRKTIVFPGLGRMRTTTEGHIFFVAEQDLDLYPGGWGLDPVSLRTHRSIQDEYVPIEIPEQEAAPVLESQPVPTSERAPEPEALTNESTPAQASNPVAQPAPPTAPIPAQTPASPTAPSPSPSPRKKKLLKALLWCLVAVAVLTAAIAILGRVAPDFMDTLLYSSEELEVIKSL